MDSRTAAVTALRAASAACTLGAGIAADAPAAWVPRTVGCAMDGVAGMVAAGPGWNANQMHAMRDGLHDFILSLPKATEKQADRISGAAVDIVTLIRAWTA